MKLTGKAAHIFFLTLALNCVVAVVYVYVLHDIRVRNEHVAELESLITAETDKKAGAKFIEDGLSASAENRAKISNQFVAKDGVVSFLNAVQALGVNNGVTIKVASVSIEPLSIASTTVETVNVSLEGVGSWAGTYRFATLLELMKRGIAINRVGFQKVEASATNPEGWKSEFEIAVLKFK